MTFPRSALRLAAALALTVTAAALAATPRTIVVRGRTLSPDGRPLAGARVMARGSAIVSALTDDRGRYTLSLPLGMPGALKRLPFRIEVRAEADGRRLPLAGGGQSLTLEASWPASAERPRVQSNRDAAATAVATALEAEGVDVAWIDADFGGAAPAPRDTVSREVPAASPAPRDSAKVVTPAPRNSVPPASAPPHSPPVVAPAPAPRDTAAVPPPASPEPPKIVVSPRAADAPPRLSPVRAIAPYAGRDSVAPADTCRCALRGTVEILWDRPLEDHTKVTLELDAPGVRPAEVSLFMGAPREFRFGPLPCGEWRLSVRPGGKLRYADVAGDSARVVHCAGATETRVVLVPVRR